VANQSIPDAVETLRGLRLLRDAGVISASHYQKGYRIVDRTAGVACACGHIPAVVSPPDGSPAVCAACWEATR